MKLKKLVAALGLAACFSAVSGVTAAASIQYYYPQTSFEDDNNDFFIDQGSGFNADGTFNTALNGRIDVGDRLVSVVEIARTTNPFGAGATNIGAGFELTGIIDGIITSKTSIGLNNFLFTFGANASSTFVNGSGGEIVRTWLASGADVDLDIAAQNCTSLADCTAKAGNGTPFISLGLSDVDDFFALTGRDNPALIAAGQPGSQFTFASYAFSILLNNSGKLFNEIDCSTNSLAELPPDGAGFCNPLATGGDGKTDLVGGGSILGGAGLTNGAFGRSDFDFDVRPVPEPATLALLGMGLLGLAGMRKHKSAK